MSRDADTPRVPELWWSKKMGVLRRSPSGRMYSTDDGHTLIALPADAVKLGDVEAARDTGYNNGWDVGYAKGWEETRAELDKLRADIRAELDDYAGSERDHYAGQSLYRSIADRLDREPGREETA